VFDRWCAHRTIILVNNQSRNVPVKNVSVPENSFTIFKVVNFRFSRIVRRRAPRSSDRVFRDVVRNMAPGPLVRQLPVVSHVGSVNEMMCNRDRGTAVCRGH